MRKDALPGQLPALRPDISQVRDKSFRDVRLVRRIALRCVDALSSTGFSLWSVEEPQLKPHRLKPVLRVRAGPAPSLVEVNPAGNFLRVHVRNAD